MRNTRTRSLILLIFWILPPLSMAAQTRTYWTFSIDRAMSVEDLLDKFRLSEYDCAEEELLTINRLRGNAQIVKGAFIKLPVFIYPYDGKSIRSSVGIKDIEIARRISDYNDEMKRLGVRKHDYKSSGNLLVPYHLIKCPNEIKKKPEIIAVKPNGKPDESLKTENTEGVVSNSKPTSGKTRLVPIFGRNYQDVPMSSNKLKGKVFYIEGGHGGPDPGAMAKVEGRTICEDEYAYDVSLRVARELVKHGATVYVITRDPDDGIRDGDFLICDKDEQTYPNLKVPYHHKTRLTQRSDAINELYEINRKKGIKDQRLMVIHVDSRGQKQETDTFLYFQSESKESKRVANNMLLTLKAKYAQNRDPDNQYQGTLTTRDLHMLRECKPTTVYVEIGNIRNEFDRRRIMIKNNRQALAVWLVDGFIK
jgi:N-acetylmuramoyl-L-alanine amidase